MKQYVAARNEVDGMRLAELKNENKHVQRNRIIEQPKLKLLDAIENPKLVRMKVLCFLGNHAEFATSGLVVRKFLYNFNEQTWIISDKDLSDGFEEFYEHHFTRCELYELFHSMFYEEGFLLDID